MVVEEGAVPGALSGQTVSAGGREADFGIACCANEFGVGGVTVEGDVTAVTAGGRFGWRFGLGAGTGVALKAGKWKVSADVAAKAERWRAEAGACGAVGEGG